ncbi:cytochrome P450 [Crucibulum laeve]|uniref:Cytochrome P450 n=1 Tax=Crucibulum laeve TaxID=68775 RepID=A0A5C3MD83_9AGAR|nr:cytochrome P450 [Crucibulum laeve]
MAITIALDILFIVFGLFVVWRLSRSKFPAPLPPGPRGFPLIGNVFDMPSEQEWLTFTRWGQTWDICSVTILGQTLVILNSAKMAFDMLDKKSALYSDRPVLQMGGELVGWKNTLVLLPYGDRFRRYRRLFHKLIGSPVAMKRFHHVEELETRRFLRNLLLNPEDLPKHIRKTAGAIILRISHGYEVREENDPLVELADKATAQFALSTAPGGFLVDLIPILRHIPAWCPGASFQRKATAWSSTLSDMVERPYNFVKEQMASGNATASFSSTLLEGKCLTAEEEFDLKWSAASLYSGGADTTVSAISSFFLAMALHPEVGRKAQSEIDTVIGYDRLPTFADRENLPYVDALVKEVFRWNSVVPTGMPHKAMQDDVHEGFFIPKGSLIIPNVWGLTHDSRTYPNPKEFKPERFIPSEHGIVEPDPRELCFGFGRRICPGLHLADASVFISCAMTLAAFNISKVVENGVIIDPIHDNTTGAISHPKPFKCWIQPRSNKAISLIQVDESK